jgi:hypothetical protein
MLFGFEGAAVPLDNEMTAYLREEDVFDEKINVEDGQRFLEHNLKAEECYEFYCVVRRALRSEKGRKKAKV